MNNMLICRINIAGLRSKLSENKKISKRVTIRVSVRVVTGLVRVVTVRVMVQKFQEVSRIKIRPRRLKHTEVQSL